jgi:hypothetical protein
MTVGGMAATFPSVTALPPNVDRRTSRIQTMKLKNKDEGKSQIPGYDLGNLDNNLENEMNALNQSRLSLLWNCCRNSKTNEPVLTVKKLVGLVAGLVILGIPQSANAGLINGGFEQNLFCQLPTPTACVSIVDASQVPGWQTTASDNKIEIWSNNFNSVPASSGKQHAELNANFVSTLFQIDSSIAAGSTIGWTFDHRGRLGVDTLELTITDLGADGLLNGVNDTVLFKQQFGDGNLSWVQHSGTLTSPALGNKVEFAFASISAAGGVQTIGNFLDNADFGVGVGSPEPSSLSLLVFGGCITLAYRFRRHSRTRGAATPVMDPEGRLLR